MKFGVKVVPGASKSEIIGWLGEDLKVRIQAPATDGQANEALCKFLAVRFSVARRAVSIVSGTSSRRKLVEIAGLDAETFRRRLAEE